MADIRNATQGTRDLIVDDINAGIQANQNVPVIYETLRGLVVWEMFIG